MKIILILFWIFLPITTSDFISPTDKFEGLTKISQEENAQVNELCGTQPGMNKMNAGTIAKKGQFPWAVAIEGNQNNRFCSGTIISQRHVLTAAHCAVNLDYIDVDECKKTSIESESKELNDEIVGGYVAYGGTCNFAVSDFSQFNTSGSLCKHDDMTRVLISAVTWERRYRDRPEEKRCTNFDIAIIEVARDFKWSDFVRPACLTLSANIFHGMIGMFYGFGQTDMTVGTETHRRYQNFPDLRYGAGELIKNDTTFTMSVAPKELTKSQRDAAGGTSSMVQVDSGDSGGGIVMNCFYRFALIGIVTESLKYDYKSKGAQVFPHLDEICEITGVCPIERMKTIFILIWISLPITTSEFVSPADKFEGLSKISKDENSQVNELCGLQPGLNKINSGTIAKKGQFPWAVAIEGRRSKNLISFEHHFGVILVDHDIGSRQSFLFGDNNLSTTCGYVAYGGNCNYAVLDTKKFNVSGSPCKRDDMTRVLISAVTWEKRYRDRSEEKRCTNFDIAIIEVARDFKWSKFVSTLSDNIFPGMIGMFYGFGTVAPKSMTEDERTTMGTCSNAQIESKYIINEVCLIKGDCGGGIVMNSFSRFSLIGISTDSLRDDYMSKGAQVFPHLGEICEITGVCPIEGFSSMISPSYATTCAVLSGIANLIVWTGYDAHVFIVESVLHSVNRREPDRMGPHDGYYGLAVSNIFFMISTIAIPIMMNYMRCKWILTLSAACFGVYFLSFQLLNRYLYFSACAILGMAFSSFNIGFSGYLTEISTRQTLERNQTLSWAFTCCSVMEAGMVNMIITKVNLEEGIVNKYREYSDMEIRLLFGAFALLSFIGMIMFSFLPNRDVENNIASLSVKTSNLSQQLVFMLSTLTDKRVLILIPYYLYFVSIITMKLSARVANFSLKPLMLTNAVIHLLIYGLSVSIIPEWSTVRPNDESSLFIQPSIFFILVIAFLCGLAEVANSTTRTVISSLLIPEKSQQVFGASRFYHALAASTLFFASPSLSIYTYAAVLSTFLQTKSSKERKKEKKDCETAV
ncbi:hypothetical protein PRIPAC_71189 [Pristionchus pacificus]|uniref:Trypsin n=1 Tax=Pristionchus pacificus TaxID=54126 RepID=A0A2A6CAE8_PRIPA|nr:hypothetical protein PRIPAC_71189 [Pristionchus pacificus]|eukprot:PDM75076.1 Trypsin [Pristionchus pacificus]